MILCFIYRVSCIWYVWAHIIELQLARLKERPNLHADGFKRVPASLPVHPHHTIVCAVLSHVLRVLSPDVVSAIGIRWVAAVVPPTTSVLSGTLFWRVSRVPGWNYPKKTKKKTLNINTISSLRRSFELDFTSSICSNAVSSNQINHQIIF